MLKKAVRITKDEIIKVYQLLLKRIPSDEEIEIHARANYSVCEFIDAILTSDEYKQNEDCENRKKGPIITLPSIERYYQLLLGRSMSEDEKAIFADENEYASIIAYNIVNSEEYKQKQEQILARENQRIGLQEMEQCYLLLLDRNMSEKEKTIFADQKPYAPEFVYDIVHSEEYKQKCKRILARENQRIGLQEMEQYYPLLLGRNMSEEEKTIFADQKPYAPEFVYDIVHSEEYEQKCERISARENQRIGLQEMEQYYPLLLNRNMSEEEKTFFADQRPYAPEFVYDIVHGEEYKQKCERISARENQRIGLQEMEQYYPLLLDRNMSEEEKTIFADQNPYAPEFVYSIVNSEEYKCNYEKRLTKEGQKIGLPEMEEYYQLLLDRKMSEAEKQNLAGYSGHAAEFLLNIVNSGEFRTKKKKSNITDLQLKSELMDTLLGRPIRDYEVEIFREQPVEDFLIDILSSKEYKDYCQTKVKDEIYQHKYGAATYKIMWDNPTTFTCVYDGVFEDVVTTEVRMNRAGIWKSQYELLKKFPKEGTFIDIGANIGIVSCMIESKGWNGYAIEASPRNVDCIRKAVYLNDLNIEIGQFAVHSETTSLSFLENGPWGLVENEIIKQKDDIKEKAFSDVKYTEVQAFCLDDWEKTGLTIPAHIDYIKMDIEGSEIAAINGMKKFLKKYDYPIIFCESNGESQFRFGHTTVELHQTFEKMGYHRYEWKDGQLVACNTKKFQLVYSMDFVFIHTMPSYLSPLVVKDEAELVSALAIKELLKNGTFAEKVHVCSELKDFKDYLADKELKEILSDYKNGEDEILKAALQWYEEIGG